MEQQLSLVINPESCHDIIDIRTIISGLLFSDGGMASYFLVLGDIFGATLVLESEFFPEFFLKSFVLIVAVFFGWLKV